MLCQSKLPDCKPDSKIFSTARLIYLALRTCSPLQVSAGTPNLIFVRSHCWICLQSLPYLELRFIGTLRFPCLIRRKQVFSRWRLSRSPARYTNLVSLSFFSYVSLRFQLVYRPPEMDSYVEVVWLAFIELWIDHRLTFLYIRRKLLPRFLDNNPHELLHISELHV